jgi:hypothetical protein
MAKPLLERYQTARDVIRDLGKVREGLSLGATQMAIPASFAADLLSSSSAGTGSTMTLEPVAAGVPWRGVVPFALLALGLGAAAYGTARYWPASALAESPVSRSSERVIGTAELDLKAKIESRSTPAEEVLAAAIRLGLIYVEERRWTEADAHFGEMEADKLYRGSRPLEFAFVVAGKLGRGVSLSYQDRPKDSNAAIYDGITTAAKLKFPSDNPKAVRPMAMAAAQPFLLRHPELSRAVAQAVTRNGENQERDSRLDWLRTPGSLIKGP